MAVSSKRAEYVALACLTLSIVFFFITFFVGRWSGFLAVSGISWLTISAILIWTVLLLQFHQRLLAEQEKLDMGQLAKSGDGPTIFQGKSKRSAIFAVAQGRLELFEKWFLPAFSVIIAVYQIAIGLFLLKTFSVGLDVETRQPLICAVCMTAIAFVSFLLSRYATGMSGVTSWKPLRAGGSVLLGIAVLCFALAISLTLAQFKMYAFVNVVGWIIPILLVVVGVETALNVVMDIYRPRLKGQYSRSAFDSRLLGLINEPGKILHTAASAIDYQFGFKVSQTWFYKLLERAIVPLILFAAMTLYLLSCVVIVTAEEEAVIEHFGRPISDVNDVRIVGPGLTLKWPWPIDIAYKYPTKKISEISIGFVPEIDPRTGHVKSHPKLWGKTHHEKEYLLLVASKQTNRVMADAAVPVNLIVAAIPIQYRIKNLYNFLYNNSESEKLLESICYRELTKFAASATIEVNDETDMDKSLLGAGRVQAKNILTKRIQAAVDTAGLGIEIVFLGLQGLHPPPEVAAEYQAVMGAVQKKQASILSAIAKRNQVLSALAGSVKDADRLYTLAAQYQLAKEEDQQQRAEELEKELDAAFAESSGDIFKTLREAQSYAFGKVELARSTGQRFASQLKAYNSAKDIYKREQRLLAFEDALSNTRKYIVVADQNDTQVFIVDVKEKLTPSLYDLGGFEENSGK